MALPRFWNLPVESRERLLAVAARHFAEGFDRASLNEILAEAGLGKSSYYYYFLDKEDLFATVLEASLGSLADQLPLLDPALDFWTAVAAAFDQWAAASREVAALIRAAAALDEERRQKPRFAVVLSRSRDLYRAVITHGQGAGAVRDDLPVDALIRLVEAIDRALDVLPVEPEGAVALRLDTFRRILSR